MIKLAYTPQSRNDLTDIGLYIARDNPARAISFVQELRTQCRKIVQSPHSYRSRPELGKGIRSCAYGNYVIFFKIDDAVLRIIRVLHGAMDSEARFDE